MPCNPSLMAMNPDDFCQDASRGLQLRELRRRLDWTQKELAEVCGVSRTSVVRWERARYQVPKSVMVLLYLPASVRSLVMNSLSGPLSCWSGQIESGTGGSSS